jgi:alkylation response protein AidB-like acyl-CoA dehydrogenase/3-hydroxyacyl-CoA dehydrogenase
LPETQLGILPAWGGTTRLPRLIGLARALDLILTGKTVDTARALRLGLIDDAAPRERLAEVAGRCLARGKRRPVFRWRENAWPMPWFIARAALAETRRKTRGLYPAPERAVRVAARGLLRSVDASLDLERAAFLDLVAREETANLMRVFHLQERAKRLTGSLAGRDVSRVAVIGAGVMGSGIAHWVASRGWPVILQDVDRTRVAAGMARIEGLLGDAERRRKLSARSVREARDRILPSDGEMSLARIDLVIEAATENLEVKKGIFRALAARTGPGTVLATNTSALPISELADAVGEKDAPRVVGLHFFNPVHQMKLVEVVVGKQTAPETVETAVRFVRAMGKLPVVVADRPGFLVNRILMPYLVEAGRLAEQGVPVGEIDRAMLDFGMPMGPLRLLDEIGLDVACHVSRTMEDAFGERFAAPGLLRRLVERGHLGKKSGRGFHVHGRSGDGTLPGVAKRRPMDRAEIADRLSFLLVNEAFRCLEEGVARSADDVDFAMIFGIGFAPFRGGPLRFAARRGLPVIGRRLLRWSRSDGPVYEPCDTLRRAVAENDSRPDPDPDPDPKRTMKPTPNAAPGVIDTSKMSPEQRAALELAEASRTEAGRRPSLAASLFLGSPDFSRILPFPEPGLEDQDQGDAFLARLGGFLKASVDPDAIDRDGEIPDRVLDGLADLGAFGIKIPVRYGGLGLSQTNYSRAAMLLGGTCGNLTALLSAHQSIGVPQPLLMFGTDAQKERYLPRLARGEISAFALTEPEVGSDPARMRTVARPVNGGAEFEITGEKLWCTNGTKAGLLVVMAKVLDDPADALRPESARTITAFIVEADAPGVQVVSRCRFMGLKALYNGVMRFDRVRVPRENILLGEGRGLKVALSTLNTGRLTLPAACAGMARVCLGWATKWARERVQWGAPVGKHDAIAQKLARMAADTDAIEAMVLYTSALVDRDKKADIRIEAALAKMWGTERAWDIVNETMQIRGGRGYETADSLRARGEDPVPVERMLRDCRINTIFEGSSEIMRLFIAREALDPHLRMGGPVLNTMLPWRTRIRAALRSAVFYGWWYPRLWLPNPLPVAGAGRMHPALRRELRAVRGLSRKLARNLFHAMLRHGPKLEKKQALLGRFVDIGAELFAMTALVARTQLELDRGHAGEELTERTRYFCRGSRLRVEALFRGLRDGGNTDRDGYGVARRLLG